MNYVYANWPDPSYHHGFKRATLVEKLLRAASNPDKGLRGH